jgi:DNA ligase-1
MFRLLVSIVLLLIFEAAAAQGPSELPAHAPPPFPPQLQLANVYHPQIDLKAYWVSEKLDGVRAYWDGHQLISKQGHIYRAPSWFIKDFPDFSLDGELWIARASFDMLSGVVRKHKPIDKEWQQVSYQVFDLPESDQIFDDRLARLQAFFKSETNPPWLKLIAQYKVPTQELLMAQLDDVIERKGEGLMLHLGSSRYHAARDDELLKLKRYFDAEAKVLEYIPGNGKFKGLMGSLLVEAINQPQQLKRFKIGSGFSHAERRAPPPIGSIITYKYFGLTRNQVPRFASFMRVRHKQE